MYRKIHEVVLFCERILELAKFVGNALIEHNMREMGAQREQLNETKRHCVFFANTRNMQFADQ